MVLSQASSGATLTLGFLRSAPVGGLHHLRGRRPADSPLLSVRLHQVLPQGEDEEAAAGEGREDRPEGGERKDHHGSGESPWIPSQGSRRCLGASRAGTVLHEDG